MPDLAWLLPIAFGVGALIGAVGIGGVLLIPALTAFAALADSDGDGDGALHVHLHRHRRHA